MRKEEYIPNQVFRLFFFFLEDHSASSFQLQAWEVVTKGSSVWRLPLLLASWFFLPTADVLGQPEVSDRPGHGSCTASCHRKPSFVILALLGRWGRLGSEVSMLTQPGVTGLSAAEQLDSNQEREKQKQLSLCTHSSSMPRDNCICLSSNQQHTVHSWVSVLQAPGLWAWTLH